MLFPIKHKERKIFSTFIIRMGFTIIFLFNLCLLQAQNNIPQLININRHQSKQKVWNVKVGDTIRYMSMIACDLCARSAEVPEDIKYKIQNTSVVKLIKEEKEAHNQNQDGILPHDAVPPLDYQYKYYYFQPISKGKTKIIIKSIFYKKAPKIEIFNINVK